MKKWVIYLGLFLGLFALIETGVGETTKKEKENKVIEDGKLVSMEYSLYLEDNDLVDTNVGGEPLTFLQGNHQIIPGLEKKLEGLKIGDKQRIKVPPEEGYGKVDPKAFHEVSKEQIPPDALKVGAPLQTRDAKGRVVRLRVHEIKESTVILDFNHPLAGKKLIFDVKILKIEDIKP